MKYKIIAIICIVLILLCVSYLIFGSGKLPKKAEVAVESGNPEAGYDGSDEGTLGEKLKKPLLASKEVQAEYISPIDFEALKDKNPDIYAWIEIPGTEISFPLLQNEDDGYYLNHSSLKEKSKSGAIFTEASHNKKDMQDEVTVVYGHRMNSGAMFGTLQQLYSSAENFDKYREIVVYLPDKELHYDIFLTTVYDDRHILQSYDFTELDEFEKFMISLYTYRSIGKNRREEYKFNAEDKMIVLSTCIKGAAARNDRFLVVAVLKNDAE